MELNKYMFREYDIRGVWNKDITEEISYLIGRAFGSKLSRIGKKKTIVGYDNRLSSKVIEKNVVKGITDSGVDVVCLGLVTTPMYYSAWDFLNIKCGIMITASHNPKDDNGFKFSYNGIHNAYGKSSLELYEMIINNDFESGKGKVIDADIRSQYIDLITKDIKLNKKLKVIYDCGNGTTSIVASDIFNHFKDKLDLIPLFAESDGTFPNHHPDPAVEENLTVLKEKVKELKADVGVAFDGDGDRVGIITNTGKFLDIDKFMILVWRDLVKKNVNKKTFYDVKCSLALKEELDKLGIENQFYRTGNSYTKEFSVTGNFPFSGELSGHVFFRDRWPGYDDGIYAALRLIEILSNSNLNIEEMLFGISNYISTPEIKIPTDDNIKFKVIDAIKEYAESKNYKIITVDGVKILYNDASALVRASNTGPNITTRFEAKTEDKFQKIKKEFLDKIDEIKKNIS